MFYTRGYIINDPFVKAIREIGKKQTEELNESIEQIDELSKTTLKSYTNKAEKSKKDLQSKIDPRGDTDQKPYKKLLKREDGIDNAKYKMKNEEVEIDDESTLTEAFGVYRKGGSIGEKHTSPHDSLVKTHDNETDAKDHAKRMNKNLSPGEKTYYGIKYHVKPIKESVEELDEEVEHLEEISKKTLKKYIKDTKPILNDPNKDTTYSKRVIDKTQKGVNLARKKLTKEEVEMIESLLDESND